MSSTQGPGLEKYRAKRDFTVTPEPSPADAAEPRARAARQSGGPRARFVVQEHHARRLHWDFRLERDGVLVSWAVPKGIPPDPKVNHLAVPTEDHPLSYADFEGEIPKGNYGAGKVMIWDRGTYECLKWDRSEVMVVLQGQRARGRYVLFRTGEDQWMMHRMDPPEDPDREPMPEAIEPMMATPGSLPADDTACGFEILWDGVRTIAYGQGGRVRLAGDGHDDLTPRYPELTPLGRALGSREVVLDGELVVLAPSGELDHEALEQRQSTTADSAARRASTRTPVVYTIYDLLYLDGRMTMGRPYVERRRLLDELDLKGAAWQAPNHHVGDGAAFLALARERGLPGIVAKRLDSAYEPGTTSGDWLEVRT